ncbi:MAG: pilin [Parcubacteria group bacterium]
MKSTNFLKYSIAMIVVFVLVGSVCLLPHFAGAETMSSVLTKAGKGLGEAAPSADKLPTIIGGYVKVFLGLTGIILVIIIVYAGFLWMTAGGDKEQVGKAKDWMINAVVGMLILLSAYAITGFVIDKLVSAGSSSTTTTEDHTGSGSEWSGGG